MNKMLYLIRGLPGSGKSTFAEQLKNALGVMDYYEADDYFYVGDEYLFDPAGLGAAHAYCKRITEQSMADGDTSVIVSNTFTTEKELKPYLALAKEYGYSVTTLIVENRHGNSSVHNVPEETIQKMRDRFSVKL